jgi:glyoxylase-like metal-dependent hydrolase (beta-lactamase superfamily II)
VTYTGVVEQGGPADVREVPGLRITKVCTPPFTNNCYLLRCTATGDTLLVDAAGDAPRLLELVGDGTLVGVAQTHGHWDHVQALAEVTAATGAPVLAHEGDAADLPVPPDRLLADGDVVEVGQARLSVVHLLGHTPGRSPWSTRATRSGRTPSPATRCSPAASATPRRTPRASRA